MLAHRSSLIVLFAVAAVSIAVIAPLSDASQFVATCGGMQNAQGTGLKLIIVFMGARLKFVFNTGRLISSVMGQV